MSEIRADRPAPGPLPRRLRMPRRGVPRRGAPLLQALGAGAVVSTLAVLSACADVDPTAGGREAGTDGGGTITVYTSEPQEKLDALIEDFHAVEPEIEVETYRAGTGDLTARIDTELATGEVQADVLLAADAATFETYKEQGLLRTLAPDSLEAVDPAFVDPDGHYVGTRVIPTVIAYNTDRITEPPQSWAELADPGLEGSITLPDPAVSGAAAHTVALWYLHDSLGAPWFTALGENAPVIADSNGPVAQSVASGQEPVGIVVDFMMRDLRDAGSPVDVHYPREGSPAVFQPAGIFASSGNPQDAQAFVDYLVSRRGQELAAEQNYVPVRDDVDTPEDTPALEDISLMTQDLDAVLAEREQALDAFDAALG